MNKVQIELRKMKAAVEKIVGKHGVKTTCIDVETCSTLTPLKLWISTGVSGKHVLECFSKYPTMKQFKQRVNIAVKELADKVKQLEANTEG